MDIYALPICRLLQEHHTNLPFVRVINSGDLVRFDDVLSGHSRPLLIADEASLAAAKPHIESKLSNLKSVVFLDPAKPELDGSVMDVLAKISEYKPDALLVIGSGSLSDIGKYASAKAGLPLIIIATAPSMNGYTSVNASLSQGGLKQSFLAKMPDRLVICEDIIIHTPSRLVQAGRADALASMSADLDWKLSGLMLDTLYYPEIFEAQLPYFSELDDRMKLLELLIIQGLGMAAAQSSAPASGGEHMLAHVVEMLMPSECAGLLHGELIALTHPIYIKHQLHILASSAPLKLRSIPSEAQMQQCFGGHWQTIQPYYHKKANMLSEHQLTIEAKLQHHWQSIKRQLDVHISQLNKPVSQLTNNKKDELTKRIEQILPLTAFTRDRFTLLDLELS